MIKIDIANSLMKVHPCSRATALQVVDLLTERLKDALLNGHRIEIRGFGSFSVNRRPPRVGRNPRSGEQVTIPEKLVPHFKPGKALREAVDAQVPVAGAMLGPPTAAKSVVANV